jgi:predicted PurR-regulated permease PerM
LIQQTNDASRADPPDLALAKRTVSRQTGILALLIVAFCFVASSICITVVLAAFLAILVDPAVKMLEKIHVPRFFAAALIILAGVAALGFLTYISYGKLIDFYDDFPRYVSRISDAVSPISSKIQRVQESASNLANDASPRRLPEVRVMNGASWASYMVRGVGSVWGAVIIVAVIPFLMFFMLLSPDKVFFCLKSMYGEKIDVEQFVGRVSSMVRSYVLGNLVIGVLLSLISMLVFWQIHLTPAVTLGVISGMLNLIPFLGVILSMAIPLMAAIFQFHTAGPFVVIVVTVIGLHLIAANVFIPRFVGSRLDVGPVAATVGLLFWGWLWGIPGLLLAVPLTAFTKLVADSNPAFTHFSNLLAREPRRFLLRRRASTATKPAPKATVATAP